MSALRDARLHMDKAREFFEAAEANHDLDLYNAAASAAVTSGINSKDAVCLATKGATGRSDNHRTRLANFGSQGRLGRR